MAVSASISSQGMCSEDTWNLESCEIARMKDDEVKNVLILTVCAWNWSWLLAECSRVPGYLWHLWASLHRVLWMELLQQWGQTSGKTLGELHTCFQVCMCSAWDFNIYMNLHDVFIYTIKLRTLQQLITLGLLDLVFSHICLGQQCPHWSSLPKAHPRNPICQWSWLKK